MESESGSSPYDCNQQSVSSCAFPSDCVSHTHCASRDSPSGPRTNDPFLISFLGTLLYTLKLDPIWVWGHMAEMLCHADGTSISI